MTRSMWCSIRNTVRPNLRADLPDEGRQLVGLLGVHARSRFVQQQQLRIRGQGPGDLQPPLLAVGQGVRLLPGNVAEVHLRQQLFHPLALPRLLLPVQTEGRSEEIAASHRQCMAVSTLSNTVWSFHRRIFWKVRAMPIRVILSGVGARAWVYSPACSPL